MRKNLFSLFAILATVAMTLMVGNCVFQEEDKKGQDVLTDVSEPDKGEPDTSMPDVQPDIQPDITPDIQPEVCVPNCADKECGNDGCGGSCGTCTGQQEVCEAGNCICTPDCAGKECGDDGCGGSCGECPFPEDEPCLGIACVSGKCETVFASEGASCNDGNLCTQGDKCVVGKCEGQAIVCNDGNVCTTDICDPFIGCVSSYNTLPCNGDAKCEVGQCSKGECLVTLKNCDDEDLCTNDSCEKETGECIYTPKKCDDANPATNDSCDEETGECVHQFVVGYCTNHEECEDGDFCNINTCDSATSKCKSIEILCDDEIACTDDSCNSVYGCVNLENNSKCPDDQKCYGYLSLPDGCAECIGSYYEVECDDGDPCTIDSCDTQTYICKHGPVNCDDDISCTVDSCEGFKYRGGGGDYFCSHKPDDALCLQGQKCVSDWWGPSGCTWCVDAYDCNDGNACTIDFCESKGKGYPGECQHTSNDCNDNNACTVDSCNIGTGACIHTAISCNDSNPCTTDTCNTETGCLHTPISGCGCTPNCSGKVCGDNGCGGSCGTCVAGQQCANGACVAVPTSCGVMTITCPGGTVQLWMWSKNGEQKFSVGTTTVADLDWWVATCQTSSGPWVSPSGWSTWPQCQDITNPSYGINCHNGTGDQCSGEAACFNGKISPDTFTLKSGTCI